MPSRVPDARAGAAGAGNIVLAPLGFLHPDGRPITVQDCEARYREVCADNQARSARLSELERAVKPDRFEHAELSEAARVGNYLARVWGGMLGLLKLVEEGQK